MLSESWYRDGRNILIIYAKINIFISKGTDLDANIIC